MIHQPTGYKAFHRRHLGWFPIQFCMVCGRAYWGGFPQIEARKITWLPWWMDYCSQKCADEDSTAICGQYRGHLTLTNGVPADGPPKPIRTAQIMTFWTEHGCRSEMGSEIKVPMQSGRTAVFKLTNIEYPFGSGIDWQWHDFTFDRYLPKA